MCIYVHADDKIVVLDYGHLKEHGSGAELIDMEDGARLTKHTRTCIQTHTSNKVHTDKKHTSTKAHTQDTLAGGPVVRRGRFSNDLYAMLT